MRLFSKLRYPEWSLKRKLFGYMLLLVALLLIALLTGLFLLDRFDNTKRNTYEQLELQMDVFEKDISTYFDHLAATGVRLSEDMSLLLDNYLAGEGISFSDIADSKDHIYEIQSAMFDPLRTKLLQENCSGAFVLLNTTLNTSLPDADRSRAGLYLQTSGYETANQDIVLYRGLSEIRKHDNLLLHNKWRMEFHTDSFPDYDSIISESALPIYTSYRITDLFVLPGTSDKAILLVVPIFGADETFYGLCGFEISNSFFQTYHAQPTTIAHPTFLLSSESSNSIDAANSLSCGSTEGYYRTPSGILQKKSEGNGLFSFTGDTLPYIGITRSIHLAPDNEAFTLSVLIQKSDFDIAVRKNTLQNILLWSLVLFFVITCCIYFSEKFLSPVLKGLEQIKNNRHTEVSSSVPEINDLFAFLADKDNVHEQELQLLMEEKQAAQKEKERLQAECQDAQDMYEAAQSKYEAAQNKFEAAQNKYEAAQTEISRLAYSRKQEVDPDNYNQFLQGIDTLTPTERKIFDYYLAGKTVKEIIEIACIKESTLRYHNQNIYGKLNVNSLKQLLRYATLMQQECNDSTNTH